MNDAKTLPIAVTGRTDVVAVCEYRTFDVWGNAKDGYEVNDSFSHGEITVPASVDVMNMPLLPGPDSGSARFESMAFASFYLTDRAIKATLGIKGKIEIDGDDMNYHITRERDGYPLADLHIVRFEVRS
jgi:hypothetical protein